MVRDRTLETLKRLIFIVLLFCRTYTYGQEKSNIGFGAIAGYKSLTGDSGFLVEYKYKKRFDVFCGFGAAKFSGLGYFIGTDVYVTPRSWQPCLGISFNYLSGDEFYIGETGIDRTDYKVNSNTSIVGTLGIRKIVFFDDKNANGFMAFTPYLCYRYLTTYNEVVYVGGDFRQDREDKINHRIGSGLGVGLKMVYFVSKNEKRGDHGSL